MESNYQKAAWMAMHELLNTAKLEKGDIIVVGCSTSEVAGKKIGTSPGPEIARELLAGLIPLIKDSGFFLACQCCEHLERVLVVEQETMKSHSLERVNVIPRPKAGGSFATEAYAAFEHPVMVQSVSASAGLDIGGTMNGMHLRPVVVPVRLNIKQIGEAPIAAARTRPRFVGGERAIYDNSLL